MGRRLAPCMLTVVGTVAWDTLALVERLAEPETTGGVRHVHADVPGGTGGNVSTALARLGARPRLVGAVGPDFADSGYERALLAAGVDLSGLVRMPTPTSRAYVFVEPTGRQQTYFFPGASRELVAQPVRGRVHFAAGEVACYPAMMQQATWVSFDPGQEVFHRDHKEILACLPQVDLLFLNRHERDRLALDVPALARDGTLVVETRGKDGTLVHAPEGDITVPGIDVPAKDPTGAGDAHRAGFLYALDKGADLRSAARFANVLGSFAVEGVGPQATLPTLAAAKARYEMAYQEAFPFA